MSITIAHTARHVPRLPYEVIADDIVGTEYHVSLVFVGGVRARSINIKMRGKDYIPNVLSFPLSKRHGEIYITPTVAQRECVTRGLTPQMYVGFLFIHGLLHLKGLDHGDRMDKAEIHYMEKYLHPQKRNRTKK